VDKAGQAYWEQIWIDKPVTAAVDPTDGRLANHVDRRLHEMFVRILGPLRREGRRLLEIGCGRSRWLPYFRTHYGFAIVGVDYAPTGCDQARAILAAAQVEGSIICADCFRPPEDLLNSFDVVWSYGVIEHFDDTSAAAAAFANYLRPGGIMITVIPNMRGLVGLLQRLANSPVYGIHSLLTAAELAAAHRAAGLVVEEVTYFLAVNFGVINVERPAGFRTWVARAIVGLLARVSMAVWALEERVTRLPATRLLAPYIVCVARKPST